MNASELTRHLAATFEGVRVLEHAGDSFLVYDPDGDLPNERMFPFVTVVAGDTYDTASALDRPGAYRLNIGVTKATYTARFGAPPTERGEGGVLDTGFDYAERDQLLPHPVYASQYWVCVVSPSDETLEAVRPLLTEAYEFAARKYANQRARRGTVS
ncbi:DUF6194 family protein [Prauserella muralis]|uniref:DUF6194 domain-containing protein n=1 Tax=Prauserella muralis TaxID=588067 RepID=A0A2V4AL12_9PSEU|nr:DUF6194 family protein [Prauserella muralis]PXY20988.1 hypothetical protein BAY60_26260 [Prauserella muralis]TWE30054.1 hypothetical protein FHX69_2750 [Prauserella muralis]